MIANAVKRASDVIDRISCWLVVLTMGGMVFFTALQIIFRVYLQALSWSEEVVRYLLVWSTFIGAGCVYKRAGHINVTFIQDFFKGKAKKFIQLLVQLLNSIFFAAAVYYGIQYMEKQGSQVAAALPIPMSLMYMAIPVGFGILLLHSVSALVEAGTNKGVEK